MTSVIFAIAVLIGAAVNAVLAGETWTPPDVDLSGLTEFALGVIRSRTEKPATRREQGILAFNERVLFMGVLTPAQAAEKAAQLCPVSKVLKGNVDIKVSARLEP